MNAEPLLLDRSALAWERRVHLSVAGKPATEYLLHDLICLQRSIDLDVMSKGSVSIDAARAVVLIDEYRASILRVNPSLRHIVSPSGPQPDVDDPQTEYFLGDQAQEL